jgi:signal transduction histidine kinase
MSGATTEQLSPAAPRPVVAAHLMRQVRRASARGWETALVLGAVVAAAVAVWLTLRAGFLAYPGWLAAQKADFILGPIGVGLYWRYRRPANRLGLLLIVLGLLGIPYILESSSNPTAFGLGVLWETPIYVMTSVVILAFPSGRIDDLWGRLILGVIGVGVVVFVIAQLIFPHDAPGFSISGCRAACPPNGLAAWSPPSWSNHLVDFGEALLLAIPLATAALLVRRFVSGTPPRRRALAIGGPIALLFLLTQAAYRILIYVSPAGVSQSDQTPQVGAQWVIAGARSAIWYGFLFALIAAELYAGRVLRTLVGDALRRPSFGDLEAMLRRPLGDPGLRLGFRSPNGRDWVDADEAVLAPAAGQRLTEFGRDASVSVAIVHDTQLSEDPELLETAGEIALLAVEHAELERAQRAALTELAESRARLAKASDGERRRLERDLHDGAQQRLTAIQIKLRLATERVADTQLAEKLECIGVEVAEAVDEIRALSHGIYPAVLRSAGPVTALRSLAMRATIPIVVADGGIGRCPASVEAAIYFCCAEAVQNSIKHAGEGATVAVSLARDSEGIRFTIADDGVGIRGQNGGGGGDGLVGMRDRIGAVGGELAVSSEPGHGTEVHAFIPAESLTVTAEAAWG